MAFKLSVLVVANRTAASDDLLDAMRARADEGPISYALLVPPTTAGPEAREAAEGQLEKALGRMHEAGLEAEGKVGLADPVAAVYEEWDPRRFDEVIVSTLPGQASKWLQVDLPHRVARMTGVKVTHVLASEERRHQAEPVPEKEKPGLGALNVLSWGGSGRERERPAEPERG
jgi:hypothetical protein